jgi:hypothetical protein
MNIMTETEKKESHPYVNELIEKLQKLPQCADVKKAEYAFPKSATFYVSGDVKTIIFPTENGDHEVILL